MKTIRMKSVLIIGARGSLGSKVLDAVLATKQYDVKALIRQASNASKVEEMGVTVLRGDMMDASSLEEAFQGVDVVINTANGYAQGHPEVDTEGANNVADAAKKCNVNRYIYCSVLTCDKAKDVEHFRNKYLSEEYCRKLGINFIALRPGAFIDQTDDYLGDGLKRGDSFAICPWNKNVEIGMILPIWPNTLQMLLRRHKIPMGKALLLDGLETYHTMKSLTLYLRKLAEK